MVIKSWKGTIPLRCLLFFFYNKLFLDKEHRSSQYADDNLLTLDGLPKSLFIALENLDFFSKFSGFKVSCSKTKIV